MYQVIVSTINTGRVRRISFDNWDAAYKCADLWFAKNLDHRVYSVEIVRIQTPAPALIQSAGRSR